MKELTLNTDELLHTPGKSLYPKSMKAWADLKDVDADIDVIITAHNFSELTNLTIQNYLHYETKSKLHIIVVESSADRKVFDGILQHPRVSRILLDADIKIKGKVHGYGSYGMSFSAAVGLKFSKAPHIFFSHSDMVACKADFLTYLKSKLVGGIRLASFTQRHVIPFTGCMMATRELLLDPALDWLPEDENRFLSKSHEVLSKMVKHFNAIDSGEQYVYSELARKNPVYVCASRGGAADWWRDPFSYEIEPSEVVLDTIRHSETPIQYALLKTSKEAFQKKHSNVIKAGHERWWLLEKPKWWRYSFDDQGDLIFIHHGRGTTLRAVKRWIKFGDSIKK